MIFLKNLNWYEGILFVDYNLKCYHQILNMEKRTESAALALFSSKLNDIIVQYETAETSVMKNNVTPSTITDTPANEENIESSGESASEDDELWEMIWTILSFIPGLNCAADVRQIFKDIERLRTKHEGGLSPTVNEIMGILMDVLFLAKDFVSVVSLAKNIAKGVKLQRQPLRQQKRQHRKQQKQQSRLKRRRTKQEEQPANQEHQGNLQKLQKRQEEQRMQKSSKSCPKRSGCCKSSS